MDRRSVAGTFSTACLASGMSALIGATALTSGSAYFDLLIYGGLAGVAIGTIGLALLLVFPDKAKTRPVMDQSVRSHAQTGGITAHTVNVSSSPPSRTLAHPEGQEFKRQLLRMLSRERPVHLSSVMGDDEARALHHEISAFLKDAGYQTDESYAMYGEPPVGMQIDVEGNRLIVGCHPDRHP